MQTLKQLNEAHFLHSPSLRASLFFSTVRISSKKHQNISLLNDF